MHSDNHAGSVRTVDETTDNIGRIEGAVTQTVLRAMEAQERARQLALQASRLRKQFQALSKRQAVFESNI